MKLAIVGATGLVGKVVLQLLEERRFPVTSLIPVASKKSAGKKVLFRGSEIEVTDLDAALAMRPKIAIFSAGGDVSKKWAPIFSGYGCFVIDNSSAWRMDPGKKLIVPEINASILNKEDKLIANPNCSTIQLVLVLAPLHSVYKMRRYVHEGYTYIRNGPGVRHRPHSHSRPDRGRRRDYLEQYPGPGAGLHDIGRRAGLAARPCESPRPGL